MTHDEAEPVRLQMADLEARAKAAETRATKAERDAANLRAMLSRFRTSLSEIQNDPGDDGQPRGAE